MKFNTLSFVVVILALAGGVYWFFFANSGSELPISASGPSSQTQAEFQSLVSQLQSISFDTRIFSDPAFTSLVDLKQEVTPESSGRIDPFAPIAGIATY